MQKGDSQEFFNLLHEDSEGLTNLDLQLVRSQLHMLEIQVTNIQSLRGVAIERCKDGLAIWNRFAGDTHIER